MTGEEKAFTQADIDALKTEHSKAIAELNDRHKFELDRKVEAAIKKAQAEAEEAAKKANMSETEKLQSDLADLQAKYQASQDTIALTTQKDDTRKKMSELGVDEKYLKYVFVPKDMKATEENIKALKADIDEIKKVTFESNVKSTVPKAGSGQDNTDLRQAFGLSK
jgi:hypothetical protein